MSALVSYSDSDEQSGSDNEHLGKCLTNVNVKTIISSKRKDENSEINVQKKKFRPERSSALPLPKSIKELFTENKHVDDPNLHQGRARSFEHVEGNWATHVHIPYEAEDRFETMVQEMMKCLRPLDFHSQQDYHISLSRTVVIRHHWIVPLESSLRKQLSLLPRSFCEFSDVKLYTNDEKTRTFLAISVSSRGDSLKQYLCGVEQCFQEFRLPKYYQPPSFHISFAWGLGDVLNQITDKKQQQLKEILQKCLEDDVSLGVISVQEIQCKIGNKLYTFPLTAL